MSWVLVIVFWYGYGTTNAVVEFSSKEACIQGAEQIKRDIKSYETTYSCVHK